MYKRLCIALILIIFLVGCSNTKVNSPNNYAKTEKNLPTSESIQQLTKDTISDRYKKSTEIHFEDYECIDNVNYLAFSFKVNKSPYYGFTVANENGNQYELAYFEVIPNDKNEKIMIYQFIGTYPGTEERKFHVTAGYVNNQQVKEVVLYYPDSIIKVINLADDQHGFLDIDINSKNSLLKIECKSNKGKILYKKDFNSSK